jgi:hypothetical protein
MLWRLANFVKSKDVDWADSRKLLTVSDLPDSPQTPNGREKAGGETPKLMILGRLLVDVEGDDVGIVAGLLA